MLLYKDLLKWLPAAPSSGQPASSAPWVAPRTASGGRWVSRIDSSGTRFPSPTVCFAAQATGPLFRQKNKNTQYACYVPCLYLYAHRSANNALYLVGQQWHFHTASARDAFNRGQIRQMLSKMALKMRLASKSIKSNVKYVAYLLDYQL